MELKEQIKTILDSNIEQDKQIDLIIKLVQNGNYYYYPWYPNTYCETGGTGNTPVTLTTSNG